MLFFFAGNSRVFPAGDLREPVKALNRCHAFLLTGINEMNEGRAEKCADLLHLKFPSKPIFKMRSCYRKAHRFVSQDSQGPIEKIELKELPKNLIVFSGIANPDRFLAALKLDAVSFLDFVTFPDHYNYTNQDIDLLNHKAQMFDAQGFLTTEKDLVRITDPGKFSGPLFSIPQYTNPYQDFDDFILEQLTVSITNPTNIEG